MKIATYNVNGIKAHLTHLLEWLARESPDVVCLQELKSLDEGFPELAIRAEGYRAIWRLSRFENAGHSALWINLACQPRSCLP